MAKERPQNNILDHLFRQRAIDDTADRDASGQPGATEQMINTGPQRRNQPQIRKLIERIVRRMPDQRDLDIRWITDIRPDPKRHVGTLGCERIAPLVRVINFAEKQNCHVWVIIMQAAGALSRDTLANTATLILCHGAQSINERKRIARAQFIGRYSCECFT